MAVLGGEEALGRGNQGEEEWMGLGRVRVQGESVSAQNVERLLLMKSGHPVILRNVPNAVPRC